MPGFASASIHYFRLPRSSWETILDRFQTAGIDCVDLYIPWNVHEKGESSYDFGEKNRDLDVVRFLGLVEERRMQVIIRPGPHVNAELRNFGLPDRIVSSPDIQAMSPAGNQVLCPFIPEPFPSPSYASVAYLEETRRWFEKVSEVLGDFKGKKGFIRMVQIDNEASLFFRDGPFDQDYRPEAVAMFKGWLQDEGQEPRDPPRDHEQGIEGLRYGLLWIRFRQWMVIRALKKMKKFLQDAGMKNVPFSHNLPPGGMLSPLSPARLKEVVDRVTTDIYATAADTRQAMNQVLLLGSVEEEPFAGELGSGSVFYTPYVSDFDNKFVLLSSLASGLRGFNLYMGAARDRWIGGCVAEDGKVERTSPLHFYQRLLMLMETVGFEQFSPQAPAAVILPRDYVEHSFLMFPFPGLSPLLVSGFGMRLATFLLDDESSIGTDVQIKWLERIEEILRLLGRASLFYILAEGAGQLDRRRQRGDGPSVVFVPTFVYLHPEIIRCMIDFSEKGTLVVAGPQRPHLDNLLKPVDSDLLAQLDRQAREGNITFVEDLQKDGVVAGRLDELRRKLEEGAPLGITKKHPTTEVVIHRHESEKRWLVFVIHFFEEKSATIFKLEKGWTCERLVNFSEGSESGEFARTEWKKDKIVALEHEGCQISILHIYRGDLQGPPAQRAAD